MGTQVGGAGLGAEVGLESLGRSNWLHTGALCQNTGWTSKDICPLLTKVETAEMESLLRQACKGPAPSSSRQSVAETQLPIPARALPSRKAPSCKRAQTCNLTHTYHIHIHTPDSHINTPYSYINTHTQAPRLKEPTTHMPCAYTRTQEHYTNTHSCGFYLKD